MTIERDLAALVDRQRSAFARAPRPALDRRRASLRSLRRALLERAPALEKALAADLRKPAEEAWITEIFPTLVELDHADAELGDWLAPRRVGNPLILKGSRSEIIHEPRGVVLIISPWNYPFQLSLCPLIAAVAAGNRVVVKPSEAAPRSSAALAELLGACFSADEVACVEGDGRVAEALLRLPFDHLFFTGGERVGRIVARAAAERLISATLELGGKSPALIDASADLASAAERIAWAKAVNAGQTCVAPDYVLVPAELERGFVDRLKNAFAALKPAGAAGCSIIDRSRFDRLRALTRRALEEGASLETGGQGDDATLEWEPTILTGVTAASSLMREEIFGPILPIVRYGALEEAFAIMAALPTPLALYVFGRDHNRIDRIIARVRSGGVCVNNAIVHCVNPRLPFGGLGASGLGRYHGRHGFETFSHARAVVRQGPINFLRALYPPYAPRLKSALERACRLRLTRF